MLEFDPFPEIEELAEFEIGLVLWTLRLPCDDLPQTFQWTNTHVWIRLEGNRWNAGFEKDGVLEIAGVWKRDRNGNLDPFQLVQTAGRLGPHLNPELSSSEKSERIWSVLRLESREMDCRISQRRRGSRVIMDDIGTAANDLTIAQPKTWDFPNEHTVRLH